MRLREGLLSMMARAELATLVEDLARAYRSGAAMRLAQADPRWGDELEAAEREVGALLQTLWDADTALADWPRALGRLAGVWARALDGPGTGPPDGAEEDEADPRLAREVA